MKAKLMRKLEKFEESESDVGMEGRRLGSVEDNLEDKRFSSWKPEDVVWVLNCDVENWRDDVVEDKMSLALVNNEIAIPSWPLLEPAVDDVIWFKLTGDSVKSLLEIELIVIDSRS